jgi:hypothetical protein
MTVLLAKLLLDVADTPPFTVDEAGIEDETVVKLTVSNPFPFELGTRRLVKTFRRRLSRERDDEDHMTSIAMELLVKATNCFSSLWEVHWVLLPNPNSAFDSEQRGNFTQLDGRRSPS